MLRLVPVALVVLLAGCTATGGPDVTGSTSEATVGVLVTSEVRYATAPEGWRDPTFDLYVPAESGAPPLAVVVPDAGTEAGDPTAEALARGIAELGVAAAVVRWGVEDRSLVSIAGRPLDEVVAQADRESALVSCGIAAASARAGPGVGSPARPLVVLGHGAGANAAGMAVLTGTGPDPGCFASGAAPHVAAAVLWDGDWFGAVASDLFGSDAATFLEAYSPWPSVDTMATTTFVEVGVNANRLVGREVEAGPTSAYVTSRDPGGDLTRDLEAVDAFADGALDPVDVSRAFAVGLGDGEVAEREREVHGEGDPDVLGPQVRAVLVESVVQLARP
jgi:hypothetical protein